MISSYQIISPQRIPMEKITISFRVPYLRTYPPSRSDEGLFVKDLREGYLAGLAAAP